MRQTVFRMADISHSFATRAKGQEVVEQVCHLTSNSPHSTLVVDWTDVKAASPSFIDEFVRGIKLADQDIGAEIVFTGLNPGIEGLLTSVLTRRPANIKSA